MNEIRVGLVDDHSIVRQGLRAMLDRQPDLRVVGEAASAAAALAMVAQARPDVVLLDLKLSAGSDREGLQVCRRDRALSGQPGSGTDDIRGRMAGPRGHQAGREGVPSEGRGTHRAGPGDPGRAPERGRLRLAQRERRRPLDARPARSRRSGPADHAREREILALLARGLSNSAIGQRLYISATTVKFHVGNVMKKLGATRRAEAVYAASKMGLI
jgi:two-component system, NarL family, response regulator DevR